MRRLCLGLLAVPFLVVPAAAQEGGLGSWGKTETPPDRAAPAFEPEEQVATGKFLTALEIKPIMTATQANWVAVREFNGQDLVYFTQILAWRCGLHSFYYAINGGEERQFDAEPCYVDTNVPNAIKADRVLPYIGYPLKSVEQVSVRLVYDDATEATASYERAAVLMP